MRTMDPSIWSFTGGAQELKKCSKCHNSQELRFFGAAKHHKDGLKSHCKKCESEYHAKRYRENDEIKKRNAAWVEANPAWHKNWQREDIKNNPDKHRDRRLKRTFGITLEQYNAMFAAQGGRCAICSRHQTEVTQTLCVDHNHKTGKIRKLLCGPCNHALGLLKEDISAAKMLVKYIKADGRV